MSPREDGGVETRRLQVQRSPEAVRDMVRSVCLEITEKLLASFDEFVMGDEDHEGNATIALPGGVKVRFVAALEWVED